MGEISVLVEKFEGKSLA